MLRSRGLQLAAGAVVFGASAFMGFHYSVSSAPPPVQEPFPTEKERRRVFSAQAERWDREVYLQELLLGVCRWRRQLTQQAKGKVLEVAAGTGRNFQYYDREKVASLTTIHGSGPPHEGGDRRTRSAASGCAQVSDFSRPMIDTAKKKKGALEDIPCSFRLSNACKLQDEDESYDTILETFALCSYEEPVKTLRELKRVLKKDGRLLLLEHGASTWPLVNLILARGCCHHVRQFGCYANRQILDLVKQSGFEVISSKRKNFGTTYMIVARKLEEEKPEAAIASQAEGRDKK